VRISDATDTGLEVIPCPSKCWVSDLHVQGDAADTWEDEWVPFHVDSPGTTRFWRAWLALEQEFDHFVFIGF
jgi:hypothetical protein